MSKRKLIRTGHPSQPAKKTKLYSYGEIHLISTENKSVSFSKYQLQQLFDVFDQFDEKFNVTDVKCDVTFESLQVLKIISTFGHVEPLEILKHVDHFIYLHGKYNSPYLINVISNSLNSIQPPFQLIDTSLKVINNCIEFKCMDILKKILVNTVPTYEILQVLWLRKLPDLFNQQLLRFTKLSKPTIPINNAECLNKVIQAFRKNCTCNDESDFSLEPNYDRVDFPTFI